MARLKAFLAFAIVMGFVYACYVMGPPFFNNYKFEDDLKTEVRFMQNDGKPDEDIKAEIIKRAVDSDVMLTPEQIKITRMNKTITVQVNYSVHVDMPGYSTDLQFHPTATNTLVM